MTGDPTPTAEQVVADAYEAWEEATMRPGIHDGPEVAIVAALRNSPEALADLNGGEWVPRSELERALLALGSLLRWADEHRISRPDEHGHDCFELWCIERDHARILLDREEP